MAYTINQLARLSGVSTRTLRFYDEIALLKPAYYGGNQYRYYKEEQLLMLQQILFFRELGFPLNDIQQIMSSDDFDKIESLKRHKSALESSLERTATLIKTIDKTISHLRGKIIMRDAEMYDGFDPIKQQEHEKYMLETGVISQKQIDDSWTRVSHWKKSNWEQFKNAGEKLNLELANALAKGVRTDSDEVQALIQEHYDWVNNFWTPTKETYLGLGKMYLDHPDFRLFYNKYHPGLVDYLVAAMRVFAERKLS
ncbi:TPA: MerR family transcriptional regulator [Legionella pneumophila]|jgi:DNA-binding transcriptional MerR regulator|uniref:MerR family transcriptional regulator n=7 Tax=Legionella TaxID=445 RepID=A0AAP3MEW2_LEGPN|nr:MULTISPECIES: MerR family transcriptional regulator [Legionellaceae]ERH41454.1 transcriptional regulator [Legionella pneumophila str. Leg01/53]ERH42740.1 transcriptional regulator [Legionella pneumophila str. Leg01/11]ERI46775.1 transcriptional regulator [Legionella pneumophila str. Leg01/20]ANN97189.1 transcriptional regulator [Legionella pneumophila]ERB42378.1 transcriptional regulator [Legionella pneumophila str. 121004]